MKSLQIEMVANAAHIQYSTSLGLKFVHWSDIEKAMLQTKVGNFVCSVTPAT